MSNHTAFHYGKEHRLTNRSHNDTITLRAGANESLKIIADEIVTDDGDPFLNDVYLGNEFTSSNIVDVEIGPNNLVDSDYSMAYYDPADDKWKATLFPTDTFDPGEGFRVTVGNFSSNTAGITDVRVFSSTIAANQVLAFSSTLNQWRAVSLGSAEFPESQVYVGNFSSNTSDNLKDVEVFSSTIAANQVLAFSSTTNTWRAVTLGSAEFPESQVYVGNFSSNTSENLKDVEVFSSTIEANQVLAFSSTTNTWRAVTLGSAEFPESQVYIGNFSSNTSDNLKDVEVFSSTIEANQVLAFSSTTNTWRAVTLGSAEFPESQVYIGNFSSNTSDNLVDVQVFSSTISGDQLLAFSSTTNTWRSVNIGDYDLPQVHFGNEFSSTQNVAHVNIGDSFTSAFGKSGALIQYNDTTNLWEPKQQYYDYEEVSGEVNSNISNPVLGVRFYNFGGDTGDIRQPHLSEIEYIVDGTNILANNFNSTFEAFFFASNGDRLVSGSADLDVLFNSDATPSDPTVNPETKFFLYEERDAPNATSLMIFFKNPQPYPDSLKMHVYTNASEGMEGIRDIRHRFLELGGGVTHIRIQDDPSPSDGFHEYEFVPTNLSGNAAAHGRKIIEFSSTGDNFQQVSGLVYPPSKIAIDGWVGTEEVCLTVAFVNQVIIRNLQKDELGDSDFTINVETQNFPIDNCGAGTVQLFDSNSSTTSNMFSSNSSYVGGYCFPRPYINIVNDNWHTIRSGSILPGPPHNNNADNKFGMTVSTDHQLLTQLVQDDSTPVVSNFETLETSAKVYVVPNTGVYRIETRFDTVVSSDTYRVVVQTQDKELYLLSDALSYDTDNVIEHASLNTGDYLYCITDVDGFNDAVIIDNSGTNYFRIFTFYDDHPNTSNTADKHDMFLRNEKYIELGVTNTTQIDIGASDTTINIKDETYPPPLEFISDVQFSSLQDNQILVYDAGTQKWKNENAGTGAGAQELDDLTDVNLTSPSNDEILIFSSSTGEWINDSPTLNINSDVTITSPTDNQILEFSSAINAWVNVDFPGVSEQYTQVFSSSFAFTPFVNKYWGAVIEFESDQSGANIAVLSEIVWAFSSTNGSLYGGYPGVYDWHQFVHYFDPSNASLSDAIYPAAVPWDGNAGVINPNTFPEWVDNLWDGNENPAINTFTYDYDDGGGVDTYNWDILRYPYVTFNSSTANKSILLYQQVVGEGELTGLDTPDSVRIVGKHGDGVLCHDPTLQVANGFSLSDASTAEPQYTFSSTTTVGTTISLLKGCYRRYPWNTVTTGNISFSSAGGTSDTTLTASGEDARYTGIRRFITANDLTFPSSNVKTITLQRPAKSFYVCALGPTPDTFSPATEVDSNNPTAANYWNEAWFTTLHTVYVRAVEITDTDDNVITSADVTLDSQGSEDNWGNVITRETTTSQGFESTGNYFGGGCGATAFFRVTLDDDKFVKSVKFTTTMPAVTEPVNIDLTDWKYGFTQMQYLLGVDEIRYEKVQVDEGTDDATTISNLETAYLQDDVTVYEIDNPGIYKLEARLQVTAVSPESQFKFVVIKNNGPYGIFKSTYLAFNQVQSLQWIELEEGDQVTLQIDEHEGETFDEAQSYFSLSILGSTLSKEPDDKEWRVFHVSNTEATQFADYLDTKTSVLTHAGFNIGGAGESLTPYFMDFEYLPSYGRILACHRESYILHYTDDDGENWTEVDFSSTINNTTNTIAHLQYDPQNDILYALAGRGGLGQTGYVTKSTDGGATWSGQLITCDEATYAGAAMVLIGASDFMVSDFAATYTVRSALTDFTDGGTLNAERIDFSSTNWQSLQKSVYSPYYSRVIGYGYDEADDDSAGINDIRSAKLPARPDSSGSPGLPVPTSLYSSITTNKLIGLPAQADKVFIWGAQNGRILYTADLNTFTYYQLDSQTDDVMVFYLDGYDLFLAVLHQNNPDCYITRDPSSSSNWTKLTTTSGTKPLQGVDLSMSDIYHPNAPNRMIRALPNGRIIIGSQDSSGTVYMTKSTSNELINIGNSLADANITTKDLEMRAYGNISMRGAGNTKVDGNRLLLGSESNEIVIGNKNTKITIENLFEPMCYSMCHWFSGSFGYSSGTVTRGVSIANGYQQGQDLVTFDADEASGNGRFIIRKTGFYYVSIGVQPWDGTETKEFWLTLHLSSSEQASGPMTIDDQFDRQAMPAIHGRETNNGLPITISGACIVIYNAGDTPKLQFRQEGSTTNPQGLSVSFMYLGNPLRSWENGSGEGPYLENL